MNVYGYGRDPSIPRYTLGRVNGTLGPYQSSEPKHFVMGRQIDRRTDQDPNVYPMVPTNGVFTFQAKVLDNKTVAADLGNALQIVNASGQLVDIGALQMAVLKTDTNTLQTTIAADQVAILGTVDYQQAGWYAQNRRHPGFRFLERRLVRRQYREAAAGDRSTAGEQRL